MWARPELCHRFEFNEGNRNRFPNEFEHMSFSLMHGIILELRIWFLPKVFG